MSGYTKLFSSILASTVWREDNTTRIVWITLLAMSDKNGVAEGSIPGLADFARVSVPEVEAALVKLSSQDEYSRSKEHGGSRICEVDGGWQILNHAKYRAKMNADERREYLRVKQAEYRKQKSTSVNNVSDTYTVLTHTEADTEADTKAEAGRDAARPVQGVGASAPGSLPRDHMKHAECGPRFLICLSPAQYAKLAPRFNAGTDAANRAGVAAFLGYAEGLVGPNQSPGDFVWLLQHYDAWLASQGRIPAAPAKTNGKPQPRTAAQIIASMKAEGSL